jgi:hypothetical protein
MANMTNREHMPKQAFAGKTEGLKYQAKGITSWPSSGRTFLISFS